MTTILFSHWAIYAYLFWVLVILVVVLMDRTESLPHGGSPASWGVSPRPR